MPYRTNEAEPQINKVCEDELFEELVSKIHLARFVDDVDVSYKYIPGFTLGNVVIYKGFLGRVHIGTYGVRNKNTIQTFKGSKARTLRRLMRENKHNNTEQERRRRIDVAISQIRGL